MVRPDPRYGETVSLSSSTIKIINDIQSGLILVPEWFNNNIEWVQTAHMTEEQFLTSYNYLITSGIAHPTATAPEPEPTLEHMFTYWMLRPSRQPSGTVEQYTITETIKNNLLTSGYIFSTREPVYSRGQILWFTANTEFPSGMRTNQAGELYTVQIGAAPQPEPEPQPAPEPAPEPQPEPEPQPAPEPEIDTSITDNMIIQRLDGFSIINGRAIGQITFTATDSFNPYYYDKQITNIIQFKTPNGVNILPSVKQNTLRFTATERTETIQYDEGMNDNTRANVESFVWSDVTLPVPFSKSLKFEIVTAPTNGEPIPIPKVQTSGFMGAGAIGALAGLILIGFIADHKG